METRPKTPGTVGPPQKPPVYHEIHAVDEGTHRGLLFPPPHCTHIMQPLDDVPYAALKRTCQKELISYNFKIAGAHMSRT